MKALSTEEYFDKIRPYLKDNDDKERCIHSRVMHSKSDNMEIMINHEAHEVKKELFDSIKNRYRKI